MLLDTTCAYCMEGELVANFGIKVCELETSTVYLFKEQSHLGRVIVAHKKHVSEIIHLTDEERNSYFNDINKVANAIHKIFNPSKINYGAYGDTGCHLHYHLVPKYKDEFEWGQVFAMNPQQVYLTDSEYDVIINKLKSELL